MVSHKDGPLGVLDYLVGLKSTTNPAGTNLDGNDKEITPTTTAIKGIPVRKLLFAQDLNELTKKLIRDNIEHQRTRNGGKGPTNPTNTGVTTILQVLEGLPLSDVNKNIMDTIFNTTTTEPDYTVAEIKESPNPPKTITSDLGSESYTQDPIMNTVVNYSGQKLIKLLMDGNLLPKSNTNTGDTHAFKTF